MGHLDREDADFLREAATFYRAGDPRPARLDGPREGSLPTSPAQFEVPTGLVKRWTPPASARAAPRCTLREIRRRTREFFQPAVRKRIRWGML